MRPRLRTPLVSVAAGMLLVGAAATGAFADSLSVGPDATKAPGASGTFVVGLLAESGEDPVSSCNANGGHPVTVTFTSTNSPVVAAPANVQLTGCDDPTTTAVVESGVTVNYVVAGSASAGASATITAAASGTGKQNANVYGTFSSDSITITVETPAPSNAAPSVTVTGFGDGAIVEIGAEPTPGCDVTDAEDENPSAMPVTDSSALVNGMGVVSVKCEYTDDGGLSDSDTKTYTLVDTTDPTITHSLSPAVDGENGWHVTAPTVTFDCDDAPGSGIQSCLADDADPASDSFTLGESASAQSVGGTATDWAGNTATDEATGLYVDLSDPTDVAFSGSISDGAHYPWGSVPAQPSCDAQDAVSGLADCTVTGHSAAVGIHTLTATATDNAGRTSTTMQSYTVDPWTLNGFYQPVDMNKVNTVKAGSTVPLKFNVFKGADRLTAGIGAVFSAKKVACDSGEPEDAIEFTTTGKTELRYDADGQQWVQNWATPKAGAGACYVVTMTTADGSTIKADFKLK